MRSLRERAKDGLILSVLVLAGGLLIAFLARSQLALFAAFFMAFVAFLSALDGALD